MVRQLEGYLFQKMNIVERIAMFIAAGLLIFPDVLGDVLGIIVLGAVMLWQYAKRKRARIMATKVNGRPVHLRTRVVDTSQVKESL